MAFEAEKFEEAGAAFRAIRRIDPTHIDHMDCYGNVLALKVSQSPSLQVVSN